MLKILMIFLLFIFFSSLFCVEKKSSKLKKNSFKDVTLSTQTILPKDKDVAVETKKSQDKDINNANGDDYNQSEVMVDNAGYETDNIAYSENEEQKDIYDENSLPYSYGVIRGVINMDGKNIMVLEGDDGSINFIYVYMDRGKLKWKLYGKIKRS